MDQGINLKRFVVGPLETNCFLVFDGATKDALIVDPGGDTGELEQYISAREINVTGIINTHGHHDHILGNWHLAAKYEVPIYIHQADSNYLSEGDDLGLTIFPDPTELYPDLVLDVRELADQDEIPVGNHRIKIVHTPGHTPGSICLVIDDRLLTGDLLFKYGVGRTDLRGGSSPKLLESLKKIFHEFDLNMTVYPGHGDMTDLHSERENNPWLQMLME